MSIASVVKVLQINSLTGSGVEDDPYRTVATYVNPETGEVLDVVDKYVNDERVRLIQENYGKA